MDRNISKNKYERSAEIYHKDGQMNKYSSFRNLSQILKRSYSSQNKNQQSQTLFEKIKIMKRASSGFKDFNEKQFNDFGNPEIVKNSPELQIQNPLKSKLRFQHSETSFSSKRPSSQYRNTSLKLDQLSEALILLKTEILNARQQTINTLSLKKQIQTSLNAQILTLRDNHKKQISGLARRIPIRKEIDGLRVKQIYANVAELWENNEQIRQDIFELKIRMENIQDVMGNNLAQY